MPDEIVRDFLIESNENLDLLDRELIKLEKDPENKDTLSSIFRTIHTIKGTCGFLGFSKLEKVAHAGENLLSLLRDGTIRLTPERTTVLLKLVDATRQMLTSIEAVEHEGERDDQALVECLQRLQRDDPESAIETTKRKARTKKTNAEEHHLGAGTGTTAPEEQEEQKIQGKDPLDEPTSGAISSAREAPENAPDKTLEKTVEPVDRDAAPKPLGKILVEQGAVTPEDVAAAVQKQLEGDTRNLGEILLDRGAVKSQELAVAVQTQQAAKSALADSSIRVDVTLLDRLMNLVGELVLARNQILQYVQGAEDSQMTTSSQHLNRITSELQESVMKTRMQPIGNIWSKFPRTVRDVAISCGKEVRIEMEGKETELDKTICEAIKDPLTHLVRNSVDHGIETPERRLAAGKPKEGLLLLRAYHEGGQVNIEIGDDGAGLNAETIKKKAVQKKLISAEQAARMTDREAANLIFLPGFSTAEKVTNVSGRGVGMDVVKTNIERIGGTVELQTKPGAGTTVKMKIPLTLAIVPALMVTVRGQRYAIPQLSLLELVRLEEHEVTKGVEHVQGAAVYRLRGQLLPLVYLDRELQMDREPTPEDRAVTIIVLQAEGHRFGLIVDQVDDTEEIVVKPLSKELKAIHAFAGATILGDGRVALILDVRGLAQGAKVVDLAKEKATDDTAKQSAAETAQDKHTLLVCSSGEKGRLAIELSLVARLEEFAADKVERAGETEVVQYGGSIMPLLRVSELVEGRKRAESEEAAKMQVVVCKAGERSIGLVVDQILDIVEEQVVVEGRLKRPGVSGTAVLQERVTDLLDVKEILEMGKVESFETVETVEMA